VAVARWEHTEVVRLLVECWPDGKEALNEMWNTPLSVFERQRTAVTAFARQEIIALLGGVC
jgi:hypothetical protein